MQCPFCKDYTDVQEVLFWYPLPEKKCSNKKYPSFPFFQKHAESTNDIFHNVLSCYPKFFNNELERSIFFPNRWLPESQLVSSKLYFKAKGDIFDLKMKSRDQTFSYIKSSMCTHPFSVVSLSSTVQPNGLTKKKAERLLRLVFNFGFECTLECPFHSKYVQEMCNSNLKNK